VYRVWQRAMLFKPVNLKQSVIEMFIDKRVDVASYRSRIVLS